MADEQTLSQYLQLCEELQEHVKLARDYAATPGNAWLAKAELTKTGQILRELEGLLDRIKAD